MACHNDHAPGTSGLSRRRKARPFFRSPLTLSRARQVPGARRRQAARSSAQGGPQSRDAFRAHWDRRSQHQGPGRRQAGKHVHDAAWAQLTAMLDDKAASAGVELVKVDPRGTSQTCPECGIIAAKTLAEREHRCECGCVLDRDVAAAKVVHFRAFGFWPGVVNMFRQHAAGEALDVEIFDPNAPETRHEIAGHLVQMIAPLGGDAPLELGEPDASAPRRRDPSAKPRKLPLPAAQLALSACHPPRALDGLAVAQGDQVRQAEVDAHAIGTGPLHGNNLHVKDDVPLVGLPREDRAIGRARKRPMPADLHLAGYTHETKLAGFAQPQPITDTKVGGVIAGTRPEPREAFAAREERLECLVQATQHLLLCRERPARQLGRRAAHALELVGLHLVADRNAASAVGRNALLEAGVVELAEVREHVAEGGGLRPGRLDAVLVAQHGHVSFALLVFDGPAHGRLGDGTDRGGEVGPAPQCRQPRAQAGELSRRNRYVKRLTIAATERVGSAATNRCTWSGITSISCTRNPYSVATSLTSSFSRRSTGGTRTGRRYLGHHTTWYFRLHTAPAFLA